LTSAGTYTLQSTWYDPSAVGYDDYQVTDEVYYVDGREVIIQKNASAPTAGGTQNDRNSSPSGAEESWESSIDCVDPDPQEPDLPDVMVIGAAIHPPAPWRNVGGYRALFSGRVFTGGGASPSGSSSNPIVLPETPECSVNGIERRNRARNAICAHVGAINCSRNRGIGKFYQIDFDGASEPGVYLWSLPMQSPSVTVTEMEAPNC